MDKKRGFLFPLKGISGCKTFVHVPKEQRSKLDNKVVLHVFVRYGDEEFGFKL